MKSCEETNLRKSPCPAGPRAQQLKFLSGEARKLFYASVAIPSTKLTWNQFLENTTALAVQPQSSPGSHEPQHLVYKGPSVKNTHSTVSTGSVQGLSRSERAENELHARVLSTLFTMEAP